MTPYLNQGRWVIDCPSLNCGGALKVLPWQALTVCDCADREFCQHGPTCGCIIQLEWPADRRQIERIVSHRPISNRNWYPWETVDKLLEENAAHGLDHS